MVRQVGRPKDVDVPERTYFIHVLVLLVAGVAVGACSSDSIGLDSTRLQSEWNTTTTEGSRAMSSGESAPDSTIDGAATRDAVTRAFEDLVARRVECGRDPVSCDVSRLTVAGSRMERQLTELMASRVAGGITASDRGSATHRIESVEIGSDGSAQVTSCLHDDTVLVVESGVFDDSVYSARSVWTLVEVDGQWKWKDERIVEWIVEGDLCTEP